MSGYDDGIQPGHMTRAYAALMAKKAPKPAKPQECLCEPDDKPGPHSMLCPKYKPEPRGEPPIDFARAKGRAEWLVDRSDQSDEETNFSRAYLYLKAEVEKLRAELAEREDRDLQVLETDETSIDLTGLWKNARARARAILARREAERG